MSLREFGEITPRELWLILDCHNEKRQQQREDMITLAYMTARFQRVAKLPKLDKVLQDSRPKKVTKRQTPEQMLEAARVWQANRKKGV